MKEVPFRAETEEEKRLFIEQIYKLWCENHSLRFSQMILNCFSEDFYYIEDDKFLECLEEFYD